MNNNTPISDEEFELIEQYLSEKLEGDALSGFQKRLVNDAAWQEKVKAVKLTLIGIREVALKKELKNISLTGPQAIVRPIQKRSLGWALAGVAASLLVVFISLAISGAFKKNSAKLFAEFYNPDSGLITSMGVTDTYDFDVAMIDYKSGKYSQAIEKWQELMKGHEDNDTLNYFTGSGYLALGNISKAIPYFERVIKKNESVFFHDAQWYLGLALIKDGKKSEAMPHIAASDNELRERLLQKLKE